MNRPPGCVCVWVGVAPYTGRFGRLHPRAYAVYGLWVMWKPQLDACVQQRPHFSTQGRNNSWQEVIFPCWPQQVTGIATYLHEHTLNKRSIMACPKSGQVCLKQQAVQFCKDLCTRVHIRIVVVLFDVYVRSTTVGAANRTDASNSQYSRSAAALEANRRRGSCTHLECRPVYATPSRQTTPVRSPRANTTPPPQKITDPSCAQFFRCLVLWCCYGVVFRGGSGCFQLSSSLQVRGRALVQAAPRGAARFDHVVACGGLPPVTGWRL